MTEAQVERVLTGLWRFSQRERAALAGAVLESVGESEAAMEMFVERLSVDIRMRLWEYLSTHD